MVRQCEVKTELEQFYYGTLAPNHDLKYYASPYYDPVKAHEYYMKTRRLKGRTYTASLNDEKATTKYAKEQLPDERTPKVQNSKEKTKTTIATSKQQMQNQITRLRDELKGMSKTEKFYNKTRIQATIDSLRAQNKSERERMNTVHKDTTAKLKE